MTQQNPLGHPKETLLRMKSQADFLTPLESQLKVLGVFVNGAKDCEIIYEDLQKLRQVVMKDVNHEPLKHGRRIAQAKWHLIKQIDPSLCDVVLI